jgi:ATP-dependent protease HslVU (ClpYQ) peptidase subunit
MTITMVVQHGDVVVLACDSASTDDTFDHVTRKGCSKGWVQAISGSTDALVGFSGNFAAGMWIRYGFEWPRFKRHQSFEEYLVVAVHPALRKSLESRFKTETDDNRTAWQLLVARPGEVFKLHACGDVESTILPFAAIGDGYQIAHGVLFALQDSDMDVWDKLELAFRACVSGRATVRGPLHMLALGTHGVMHSQEEK